MAQVNFQIKSSKEHGVESAHNSQEISSDTRQSITASHFPEVPPAASPSGCNPHHQLFPSTALQLEERRHRAVFNCESKRI